MTSPNTTPTNSYLKINIQVNTLRFVFYFDMPDSITRENYDRTILDIMSEMDDPKAQFLHLTDDKGSNCWYNKADIRYIEIEPIGIIISPKEVN